ncbi:hypothetical protein GYH30_016308 [Glycine max]|uniref:C-JID domain-containing protein n=1 Tax=Glycine max TaxID=3847 RepID=A0A0R0JLP8_SOYBN|nr:hypothetical protein GYH30_016308 [Glycine max]
MIGNWIAAAEEALFISITYLHVRLFHSYYKSGSASPGSEIPRWLNNQHVGNCVSLDAPPVMHDHNWIGVAFCAIFAVPQETISAMGVSGPDRRYPDSGDIPVDFYGDVDLELVLDKSDHMWLFFLHRETFLMGWIRH